MSQTKNLVATIVKNLNKNLGYQDDDKIRTLNFNNKLIISYELYKAKNKSVAWKFYRCNSLEKSLLLFFHYTKEIKTSLQILKFDNDSYKFQLGNEIISSSTSFEDTVNVLVVLYSFVNERISLQSLGIKDTAQYQKELHDFKLFLERENLSKLRIKENEIIKQSILERELSGVFVDRSTNYIDLMKVVKTAQEEGKFNWLKEPKTLKKLVANTNPELLIDQDSSYDT